MTIRIRRGAAVVLLLFVSTGCSSEDLPLRTDGPTPAPSEAPASTTPDVTPVPSPSPTGAEPPGPTCPNQAEAVGAALQRDPAGSGDIDGQGGPDPIFVVADEQGAPGCAGFVVVDLGTEPVSAAVSFPEIDPRFGFPSFNSTADINDVPGEEIVVNVMAGASTQFVSVYTFDGAALVEVSFEKAVGDETSGVFGFGGSVGHVEAVDCVADSRVVVSSATPKGRRYALSRLFLDPLGAVWNAVGAERSIGSLRQVTNNPEFAGSPFLNCS